MILSFLKGTVLVATLPVWGVPWLVYKAVTGCLGWFSRLVDNGINYVDESWQPTGFIGKACKWVTLPIARVFMKLSVMIPGFPVVPATYLISQYTSSVATAGVPM